MGTGAEDSPCEKQERTVPCGPRRAALAETKLDLGLRRPASRRREPESVLFTPPEKAS